MVETPIKLEVSTKDFLKAFPGDYTRRSSHAYEMMTEYGGLLLPNGNANALYDNKKIEDTITRYLKRRLKGNFQRMIERITIAAYLNRVTIKINPTKKQREVLMYKLEKGLLPVQYTEIKKEILVDNNSIIKLGSIAKKPESSMQKIEEEIFELPTQEIPEKPIIDAMSRKKSAIVDYSNPYWEKDAAPTPMIG